MRAARVFLVLLMGGFVPLSGCTDPTGLLTKEDRTGPGELAVDYVSNAKYARLHIELDYVSGSAPNDAAISLLKQRIAESSAKGGNIEVHLEAGVPGKGTGHRYTFDEIREIEKSQRKRFSQDGTAVLYVLYLDGGSANDRDASKVLAAAYRGSSVVVFKATIRDTSRPDDAGLPIGNSKPREKDLEGAVLVHEFGHVAGLVNNGAPMVTPHEDPDHPGHSANEKSVMHWAVESSAVLNLLDIENIPNDFDANDDADLRALRGA